MTILPGRRLGPYEILSAIGAGGMGEVYKARDTRLDRTVAIKVLPTHLADRAELRERFEREAKTIASLNHPHICTLYDMGRQDARDFLVMEYIEGETLAQRLTKGALPLSAGHAIRNRDCRRPGQGASQRHHPPRPEARQHHADQVGHKAAGLWFGETAAGPTPVTRNRRLATLTGRGDSARDNSRHAAIHGTGAGGREDGSDRRAHGHFRVRRGGLRNGDGEEGVRGEEPGQPDGEDIGDGPCTNGDARADDATGARPCRQAVHGKRPGRALAIRA